VTGDPLTDTPLLQRTTAAVLAKQVARRPDAIALVGADGTQMTYQDVGRRSDGIASGFRRLGFSRHEKVLLGHLFYVDRRKDSLRRRGENVSSFEIEQLILERSEIVETAVVAVAGEHTEDELKAVLVLREGASFDPNEMLRDLYHRMPYFMVPRYFEVVDSLPRTPTHKVMKHRLRTAGVTAATWDATAAGFRVTRHQLVEPT
jgi:acyl-CoA synthetase (AMP-forming)/AMP-acid ligase II